MSGKLPIDRAREAQDAPAIYDEHRERLTQKQARLERANLPEEGERPPENSGRLQTDQPADDGAAGAGPQAGER